MTVPCERVLKAIQALCPPGFALPKDPTGLQLGSRQQPVSKVLTCLDLTLEVAEEAVRRGANLVVSHHAVIYRPVATITDDHRGRILRTLIQGDVAVYVPHTALDVTLDGLNDSLAKTVGLDGVRHLSETDRDAMVAFLVPMPASGLETLERLVFHSGGSSVLPLGDHLAQVTAPADATGQVRDQLATLTGGQPPKATPLTHSEGLARGIGRIGILPQPEPLEALAKRVKQALGAPQARVVAGGQAKQLSDPVERVAVLGGDGRSFVSKAARARADVLITGDVDHHTALEARARGLAVIDLGHWASESMVAGLLAQGLSERLGDEVEVFPSEVDTQPFTYL